MEQKSTFEKWRNLLMRADLVIIFTLSAIEIGMYSVLKKIFGEVDPFAQYVVYYVFLPLACNMAIWLVGAVILHIGRMRERSKNYIPYICLAGTCTVVACSHPEFAVALGFFSLVVILSGIFSDIVLTKHMAVLCMVLMILSAILSIGRSGRQVAWYWSEVFITGIFLIITYYCSKVIIHYSKEQILQVKKSYNRVGVLEQNLRLDRLTGLYNQVSFFKTLEEQVAAVHKSHQKLSLVVIDIDDFKKVNDTYGHANGNVVLENLSHILRDSCREVGYASRYGGEEFAILFYGLGEAEAFDIMEQARTAFSNSAYPFLSQGQITFSCGIQQYFRGIGGARAFFDQADKAMYSAKRNGKNRCCKGIFWDGTGDITSIDSVLANQIGSVTAKYTNK